MRQAFPKSLRTGLIRAESRLDCLGKTPTDFRRGLTDIKNCLHALRQLRYDMEKVYDRIETLQVGEVDRALAPFGVQSVAATGDKPC
jgi:hypothetical protein